MTRNDVRLLVRRLASQPGFTLLVVLPLAVAIGAATAVFSVVDQTILRPPPFAYADRLVDVMDFRKPGGFGGNSLIAGKIAGWQAQPALFERFEAYGPVQMDLTSADAEPIRIRGLNVTLGLFSMLDVHPRIGRAFADGDGHPGSEPVVIVSDAIWRSRLGGTADALGRQITLNDQQYRVIGVMPRRFHLLSDEEALWMSFDVLAYANDTTNRGFYGLGRLAAGVRMPEAQTTANQLAERLQKETPIARSWYLGLEQKEIARVNPLTRRTLFILLAAVGLFLLITCANVASLFLAQAPLRQQEMAIRSALGAGRRRLIVSILAESLLLSITAGLIGLLLARWGIDAVVAAAPERLSSMTTTTVDVDLRVVIVAVVATLVTGIIVGLLPAIRGSRPAIELSLRRNMSASGRLAFGRVSGMLVVVEVALSVILLIGAALMMRTLTRLEAIDPGFDSAGLVAMRVELPSDKYPTASARLAFFETLFARLRTTPGISAAAASQGVPPQQGGFLWGVPQVENGTPAAGEITVPFNSVTPTYFETIGIRFVHGNNFTDRSEPDDVIVSRGLAQRLWSDVDAAGRRFRFDTGPWRRVVGVVENVETRAEREERTPWQMYYPWVARPTAATPQLPPSTQGPRRRFYDYRMLVVRAQDPLARVPEIIRHVRSIDRDQPVHEIKLVSDIYSEAFARQRFMFRLMGTFSTAALLLTAIGIFAVLAQSVAQRAREIGVRMALGATPSGVIGLILSRALALSCVGCILGVAGAASLSRFVQSLLFEVGRADAFSYLGVTALIVIVVPIACWLPARAAMRVEPAVALRAD